MARVSILEARCIELDLREVRKPRPTGVYFLILDGEVVYVGASTDVPTRILHHLEYDEPKKKFDRVMWFAVPADQLDAYKGTLVRALVPKYNGSAPREGSDPKILDALGIGATDESRKRWSTRVRQVRKAARVREAARAKRKR